MILAALGQQVKEPVRQLGLQHLPDHVVANFDVVLHLLDSFSYPPFYFLYNVIIEVPYILLVNFQYWGQNRIISQNAQ
jgi:hypothetical protein